MYGALSGRGFSAPPYLLTGPDALLSSELRSLAIPHNGERATDPGAFTNRKTPAINFRIDCFRQTVGERLGPRERESTASVTLRRDVASDEFNERSHRPSLNEFRVQ
ncbi:unnamed protein product, partial [Iphiclides podalirius]